MPTGTKLSTFDVIERLKGQVPPGITVFAIPRGGMCAAALLNGWAKVTCCPDEADAFLDDIIDSGRTRREWTSKYPGKAFYAVVNKQTQKDSGLGWVQFPWEECASKDTEEHVVRLIEYIGENPNREGLQETPSRVIRSFEKLYGGYQQKPEDILKVFEEDSCDEFVLLKDIEFYSTCEHHMLPFHGKAHIAYIPNGKVIGISKLARLLEIFARRLQIQERIGQQVTSALEQLLSPLGSACILEAQHFCMTSRGVEKQNSIMVTSSLTGVFQSEHEARAELMSLIKP